jgi:hypothetical protein
MGLGIYLATKDGFGEVEYVSPEKDETGSDYLSRSLCYAYCDYDELGEECVLYRSIKEMRLNPEPLFMMEYFRYGELSYLDFLISQAETDEDRLRIRADYQAKMDASWQPIDVVLTLLTAINDYLGTHDITKQINIDEDYQSYFARNESGGKSLFEKDMLFLTHSLNFAQKDGRQLVSFDMG